MHRDIELGIIATRSNSINKVFVLADHKSPTLSILKLVTGNFTWLVIVANVIASVPLYFVVRALLGYYSYSISINAWWFVLTALGSLLLAWLNVGWQSYRISQTNPAEVIRYE